MIIAAACFSAFFASRTSALFTADLWRLAACLRGLSLLKASALLAASLAVVQATWQAAWYGVVFRQILMEMSRGLGRHDARPPCFVLAGAEPSAGGTGRVAVFMVAGSRRVMSSTVKP